MKKYTLYLGLNDKNTKKCEELKELQEFKIRVRGRVW